LFLVDANKEVQGIELILLSQEAEALEALEALEAMLEERQSDRWTLSAMEIGRGAQAVSLQSAVNSAGQTVAPEEAEPLLACAARIMRARCAPGAAGCVAVRSLALFQCPPRPPRPSPSCARARCS